MGGDLAGRGADHAGDRPHGRAQVGLPACGEVGGADELDDVLEGGS
jgi:hypothetical protein